MGERVFNNFNSIRLFHTFMCEGNNILYLPTLTPYEAIQISYTCMMPVLSIVCVTNISCSIIDLHGIRFCPEYPLIIQLCSALHSQG